MVTPEQVRNYIAEGLPCEHLEVSGDGHHFEAVIVSADFRGKTDPPQRGGRRFETSMDQRFYPGQRLV